VIVVEENARQTPTPGREESRRKLPNQQYPPVGRSFFAHQVEPAQVMGRRSTAEPYESTPSSAMMSDLLFSAQRSQRDHIASIAPRADEPGPAKEALHFFLH